jgi:hypothetical protein
VEWVLLVLAGGGAASWGGMRLRDRLSDRRAQAEELTQVLKLCDEDITLLGEQLQRLDAETKEHPLDDAARLDYQTALDAYESAQFTVKRITVVEQISSVTDTLSSGRYALACVQARVAGEPRPQKRVPCFFNPQHGPSVTEVMFTPGGRGTRKVPACAHDADRVKSGEKPEIRMVVVGGRRVAYYEAGAAMAPYSAGYFVSATDVQALFIPEGRRDFGVGGG